MARMLQNEISSYQGEDHSNPVTEDNDPSLQSQHFAASIEGIFPPNPKSKTLDPVLPRWGTLAHWTK
jgi:hypothetical protein